MMTSGALDLADWRRRVAEVYAAVRGEPDPAVAHAGWCAAREDLLRHHPQSPVPDALRAGFRLECARYDAAFRFDVPLEPAAGERRSVPTGTDGVVDLDRVGRVELAGLGALDVWWVAGYAGGLFLPVRDSTSGATTYGGGRYVLDTRKGADLGGSAGRLVVDLNFAYPPSCAYDPSWACPLPGPGNRLQVPVPVGELLPG
jgi:hypothetical protein